MMREQPEARELHRRARAMRLGFREQAQLGAHGGESVSRQRGNDEGVLGGDAPGSSSAGASRQRPEQRAAIVGTGGGDGDIARGEGERERARSRDREERGRRKEWLSRLTGPEPVFDLVQPSWTKDLLVISQNYQSNQFKFKN